MSKRAPSRRDTSAVSGWQLPYRIERSSCPVVVVVLRALGWSARNWNDAEGSCAEALWGTGPFRKVCRRSNWSKHMAKDVCSCKEGQPTHKLQHKEPDRPPHDRPAASFIAQPYFSFRFISLRFHCWKEKFGAIKKCCYINYFLNV